MKKKTETFGLVDQVAMAEAFAEILSNRNAAFRFTISVEGLVKRGENTYNHDPDEYVTDSDVRLRIQSDYLPEESA